MTTPGTPTGGPHLPHQTGVAVLGAELATRISSFLTATDGAPLVTYVDHETDERTELSVATVANWSSKLANLLQFEVEEGATVGLRTAGHWAAAVAALGAWRLGVAVRPLGDEQAESGHGDALTVAYGHLARPDDLAVGPGLGGRLLPGTTGVRPFVEEVLAEPDDVDADDPGPDAVAVRLGHRVDVAVDFSELAGGLTVMARRRTLLLEPLDGPGGLLALAAAVLHRAALVVLRRPRPDRLARLVETERVDIVATSAMTPTDTAGLLDGLAAERLTLPL